MFYVFYYELNIGVCDFQIAGFLKHLFYTKFELFWIWVVKVRSNSQLPRGLGQAIIRSPPLVRTD